jgi:PKD repeat protein
MRRSLVVVLTLVLLLWGAVLLACPPTETVSAHWVGEPDDSTDDHNVPGVVGRRVADGTGRTGSRSNDLSYDVLADVGPIGVAITGPTAGAVQISHAFTATVSPVSVTIPVTYFWRASEQDPVTRAGGLSDTVTFSWDTAGSQVVTVTVANAEGAVTDTHVISTYVPVQAAFNAAPLIGKLPLTVVFTDTSTGTITSWLWDFGDTVTSPLPSPTHTYNLTGTFTVSLTVNGLYGSDTEVKTNYITVCEPVVADFTAVPTEGVAPLQVQFTNLSTGDYATSLWHFGDGISSTQRSPTHTYTTTGTRTVTLTVSGLGGEDTETKAAYITVGQAQEDRYVYLPIILRNYTPLQADFTASPTSGPAPLTVVFTNASLGYYTDSLWDFGDGITSTQTSPTHTYTTVGAYTVTLTVSDLNGTGTLLTDTSTLVRPSYITVSEEGTPQPPSDLQATAISWTEIRLDWQDDSDDETGFTIYDGTGFTNVPSNTTLYTDTGLAPGSYHCYLVRAFNEHGDSDWSDWACATTFECDEVITNGSFENNSGWVIPDTVYPATYTTVITRTGARSMRAGIVKLADRQESYSSFRQAVTIPSDAVSATLRFWLYPLSGESPITTSRSMRPLAATVEEAALADDRQYVIILDESDTWIRTLVWQRTDDQEWTSWEFDMGVHAGKTVKVQFGVYNDELDGITAMYVDDVSLQLCGSSAQDRPSQGRLRWALDGFIGLEEDY